MAQVQFIFGDNAQRPNLNRVGPSKCHSTCTASILIRILFSTATFQLAVLQLYKHSEEEDGRQWRQAHQTIKDEDKQMKKEVGLLRAVVLAVMMYTCQAASNLHPLILIPGNGGNQLEARLTAAYKPTSLLCNRWYPIERNKEGWFRLWFDPSVLLAPFTTCFAQRMTLYYDPDKDDYHNAPGVQTRVPHFGSTQSLLFLDPNLK